MNENLKVWDVFPVKEKGSDELKVAGRYGKTKAAKPENGDNPDSLKIDSRGNILENSLENFKRQFKDPTHLEFFRVPADRFKEVVQKLQEAFKNPDKPKNKEFLDMYRVHPDDFLKKQKQTQAQTNSHAQTSEKTYAISPSLVQWDKLEKFGITSETLEKTGNFDKLLDYRKTDLLPVIVKVDDETTLRTDARFSLRRQADGSFVPVVHPIRKAPHLEHPYFGLASRKWTGRICLPPAISVV